MAEDVQVVFGANIAALLRGVDEAKNSIASVKDTVDSVADGMKALAAAVGIAFSVDKLTDYIDHMTELGARAERTMAILGLTAQQSVEVSSMAKIAGTNIDALTGSLGRMALNVQRSAQDAFSPAAQGLKVLGLNARDFVNLKTDQYIDVLHKAVARFNPDMNLFAALQAVGGRNIAQMIPFLRMSEERWNELRDAVRQAQEGLAAAVPGMADTRHRLGVMAVAAEGLGARIFTVLKPAIDLVIDSFTKWMQKLDSKTIRDFSVALVETLGTAIIEIIVLFKELADNIDIVLERMSRVLLGGAIGGTLGLFAGGVGAVPGALLGGGIVAAWDAFFKPLSEKSKADADKLRQDLTGKMKAIRDAIASSLSGGAGSAPAAPGGASAAPMNLGGRDAHQAALAAVDAQVMALRQGFERAKILYEADANNYRISQSQKYALIADELQRTVSAEIAKYQAALTWGNLTLKERQDLENKILQLKERTATEILKIEQQQFAAERGQIAGFVGSIEQSWSSSLRGMLAGTESWGQAARKVMADFAIYGMEWLAKKFLFEKLTTALTTALHVQSEATKTGATIAGVSARTGAEQAGASASMITMLGNVLKSIMSSVGQVFAGVSAFLAPILGPAAPAAAAGVAAGVESAAVAMIPAFDEGTNMVLRSGLAFIHEGEKITPARGSGPFSSEGPGTRMPGGATHLHVHAVDGPSVHRFFQQHGDMINRVLHSKAKLTPSAV